MLAVFTHCTMDRYGGYSGVGSSIRNLLSGFDDIGFPYLSVPAQLPPSPIAKISGNRFLNEQADIHRLKKLAKVDSVLFPNYFLPPFGISKLRSTVIVHDTLFADIPSSTGFAKRQWLNLAFGRLLKSATNVVFISDISRDRYLKHFGGSPRSKYWVIPNCIDERTFTFQPNRVPNAIPKVLSISSFSMHKNYETFIRLAARFKGRAEFISIGKAPGAERWKQLIQVAPDIAAHIGDVSFTGYVSERRLIELMSTSDVLLQPSRYEGFCMPPVEAIALGLPVIASDIPPLHETLSGKAMFVSDPDDVAEWQSCLERLLSNPPGVDVRAAWSAELRELHSRKTIAQKFVEVVGPC